MRAGSGRWARILSTASTGSFSGFTTFTGDAATGNATTGFSSRFLLAIHRFIIPGPVRRSLLPFQNLFQKVLEESMVENQTNFSHAPIQGFCRRTCTWMSLMISLHITRHIPKNILKFFTWRSLTISLGGKDGQIPVELQFFCREIPTIRQRESHQPRTVPQRGYSSPARSKGSNFD